MPKPTVIIPTNAAWTAINGQEFLRLKEAAKLAGIHPVILDMGKELLKKIGGHGAQFILGTPDMQKNGDAVIKTFKVGLRKVAKALEPERKIKLKAFREGNRLIFYFSA